MKNLLFIFAAFVLTFASCGKAEVNEAVLTGEENAALSVEEDFPTDLVLVMESVKTSQTWAAVWKDVISHMVDYRYPREITFPYDVRLEYVFDMWDDFKPESMGKYYTQTEILDVPAGSFAPAVSILHKGYMGADPVLMMSSTLREVRVIKKNTADKINYTVSILPVNF